MIPISIEFDDLVGEFDLSQRELEGLIDHSVKELAVQFGKAWEDEAKYNLAGTRNQYIQGLVVGDEGIFKGSVSLVGFLPNAIESGLSAFDQKQGFSQSNKRKMKKDGGWYLTVPFRHATPDALGESSVFSSVLPPEVYSVMKSKRGNPITGRKVLSRGELPAQHRIPSTRKAIQVGSQNFLKYKHKSAKYEGLRKNESVKGGSYGTFRRVSDKSDTNAWIHPGILARNFAEQAFNNFDIDRTLDIIVDEYLVSLGVL